MPRPGATAGSERPDEWDVEHGHQQEEQRERKAGLPVVAEPIARGLHHHEVRGRRDGRQEGRGPHDGERHHEGLHRQVQRTRHRDGDRRHDEHGRGVADELAQHQRDAAQREQCDVGARVAQHRQHAFGDEIGGAGADECRRQRDHAGDQHHRGPRDRVVRRGPGDRAGEHERARREQCGHRRRHETGREQQDHGQEDADRALRAAPERHRPAQLRRVVDDEHARALRAPRQVVPGTLQQERVAGLHDELGALQVLVAAARRQHDEVAVGRRHAGAHARADQGRPRRHDDLGHPAVRTEQHAGVERQGVLLAQHPRVPHQIHGHQRALALGEQPTAEQQDHHGAEQHRNADERELEEPELPPTRARGELRHDDVDRRAGEQNQRAGGCRERERHEQLRRCDAGARRDHDDQRQQGRDRAVDADERRQAGDQQRDHDDEGGPLRPCAADHLLSRPRGDARRIQRLADHEQRGDEEHGRIAESRQGFGQREHSGEVERQGDADRHDPDGHAVAHEGDHREHQDDKGCGDGVHAPSVATRV